MRRRLALCVLVFASGCSWLKPRADPTRFFVLTAEPAAAASGPVTFRIGLQRVELPEYLLRLELVTRLSSNQLKLSEFDRWGEPVKLGFSRTLRQDLGMRLGDEHVLEPPFDAVRPPELLLDVEVRRFERVSGGAVVLQARWTVRDAQGAIFAARESQVRQAAAGSDAPAAVAALSRALDALAQEIADAVRVPLTRSSGL